jgi:protein-S-isoprenylcysteine O-methyltransferase Ste14
MISPNTSVALLWATWLFGWIVAARSTPRNLVLQNIADSQAHEVFLWGGAVLLFVNPRRLGFLGRLILPSTVFVSWGGVLLVFVGLGFAVWARVHLGRLWSGTVTLKTDHELVRTGPYAITRHPIYTGLLLALLGTALVQGSLAALVGLILLGLGLILKINQEERLLIGHFGDMYRAYRSEVPALVPRPW